MSKKVIDEKPAGENLLCPIRYTIDMVGGKWKLPIICMIVSGQPTRYSIMMGIFSCM